MSKKVQVPSEQIVIGNRIPRRYFVTSGRGESDITVHAGSYHLALRDAGIEMCNHITYSSILPACAVQVRKPKPEYLVHGSVMESIMAVGTNKAEGERVTAGIIHGWLRNTETSERHGGLVCEYNGNLTAKDAGEQLRASLDELHSNGYEHFGLGDIVLKTESFVPKKKFGTALVAICFVDYIVPVLGVYKPGTR